jgi:hypothetical protein
VIERRTSAANIKGQIPALDRNELPKVWQNDWKKSKPRYRCDDDANMIPIAQVDADRWEADEMLLDRTTGLVFEEMYERGFWIDCTG